MRRVLKAEQKLQGSLVQTIFGKKLTHPIFLLTTGSCALCDVSGTMGGTDGGERLKREGNVG